MTQLSTLREIRRGVIKNIDSIEVKCTFRNWYIWPFSTNPLSASATRSCIERLANIRDGTAAGTTEGSDRRSHFPSPRWHARVRSRRHRASHHSPKIMEEPSTLEVRATPSPPLPRPAAATAPHRNSPRCPKQSHQTTHPAACRVTRGSVAPLYCVAARPRPTGTLRARSRVRPGHD